MAILVTCPCGKDFETKPSRLATGRGVYCTKKCLYTYRKQISHHTEQTKIKIGQANRGKKRSLSIKQAISVTSKKQWSKPDYRLKQTKSHFKGDCVGYSAIHKWLLRTLGRADKCSFCGETNKKIQWANKSHEYYRKFNDYIPLCISCHRAFDKTYRGSISRRFSRC